MLSCLRSQRQLKKLTCLCRSSSLDTTNKNTDVAPPVRIKRGPTDVLQALASTIGRDPTAAHYKYHDDPYLTPQSNFHKRSYALSQESGRKAAVWIRDQHAELFTERTWDPPLKMKTPHFNADPRIPAYAPRPFYNEAEKVSEQDLTFLTANAQVEDAIRVYSLLDGKVSEEAKKDLLELLCYSNEKELAPEEWPEERWYSQGVGRQRRLATWKAGGIAEELFNSLKGKDARSYCALISGMAKYAYAERAYQLSREALDLGHKLNIQTYNNLIEAVGFMKEGAVQRIEQLKQILTEIREQGLSPTSQTLTCCLSSMSGWGGSPPVRELALKLLAEFRALSLEPALGAYYAILCIFCKENGPRTDVLTGILDHLEKKDKYEAQDPKDIYFFVTAMSNCNDHLQDVVLAERVHNLLLKWNYKLLGDSYKESIYYRNYISINCRNSPAEKVCELLDDLVPNIYIPEPSVMEEIIQAMELGGLGDRLAQCWSQMLMFGLARRTALVERLLDAMRTCYSHQDEEIKSKMRSAAAAMLEFSESLEENEDSYTPAPKLSAPALSTIAELCSTEASTSEAAERILSAADRSVMKLKKGEAAGIPTDSSSLVSYAVNAAKNGRGGTAAIALQYLSETGLSGASEACLKVLQTMLGRELHEVKALVANPPDSADQALMDIVQAYYICKSSEEHSTVNNASGSSSDSDSSSSDDERH